MYLNLDSDRMAIFQVGKYITLDKQKPPRLCLDLHYVGSLKRFLKIEKEKREPLSLVATAISGIYALSLPRDTVASFYAFSLTMSEESFSVWLEEQDLNLTPICFDIDLNNSKTILPNQLLELYMAEWFCQLRSNFKVLPVASSDKHKPTN